MNSLKSLNRIGQLTASNVRRFADKKAVDPKNWKQLDSKMPEGLHPKFYRLKELQKKFQEPNGVPTYLKGGVKDKIFLGITCASLVAGAVLTVDIIRSLP